MMTRHDYYEAWMEAQAQKDRLEDAGLSASSALEALIEDMKTKFETSKVEEV